jgi:hypothetical protein|tara:strand:+ start:288 stop:476 length:189 start_codon:yes stop_codon:yes gene_type:complete
MKKQIGNFIVENTGDLLLVKDLTGNVLKGEAVKPFDSDDKFKQLCIDLTEKIAERKAAGLTV